MLMDKFSTSQMCFLVGKANQSLDCISVKGRDFSTLLSTCERIKKIPTRHWEKEIPNGIIVVKCEDSVLGDTGVTGSCGTAETVLNDTLLEVPHSLPCTLQTFTECSWAHFYLQG